MRHSRAAVRRCRAWLSRRHRLSGRSGRDTSRLFAALIYTDDPVFLVAGADRIYRALQCWHIMMCAIRLIMAGPEKRELGVVAGWLGFVVHAALRAAFATEDKRTRALLVLTELVAGRGVGFRDYESLLGLLEHVAAFSYGTRVAFYGLYEVLRRAKPNDIIHLPGTAQLRAGEWAANGPGAVPGSSGFTTPHRLCDCCSTGRSAYLGACKGDTA